ncbi:MAG: YkvA family protein, partial [Rectinema sp.]
MLPKTLRSLDERREHGTEGPPARIPRARIPRRRPAWYSGLKRRARKLKRQIWALFLALKDPQTPWTARIVICFTVVYAVRPIDLIPDFIPILGQLDDLVVLPGLIALALR